MTTSGYTAFEVGTKDRVVGLFVIGAVLLFLMGFLIPFVQKFNADDGIPFYSIIDKTYGIAPDSKVSMRGVIVGNVTQVAITDDATVRVDFRLSSAYSAFYKSGSRMSVDSNIGVNTILSGSGLILIPGPSDNELMSPGEFVPTEIPQGIGSILDELDIVQLTDQVTEIVTNIEEITTGVNHNQEKIYASLDNLQEITANLAEISRSLPAITQSVDQSLVSLQSTMAGVDSMVQTTDKNLQPMLKDMTALTQQATLTLSETEELFRSTTPVMNQLPTFLRTTDVALQSITGLTDQLSQSWLLGGGDTGSDNLLSVPTTILEPLGPTLHPHDDSLYEEPKQNP